MTTYKCGRRNDSRSRSDTNKDDRYSNSGRDGRSTRIGGQNMEDLYEYVKRSRSSKCSFSGNRDRGNSSRNGNERRNVVNQLKHKKKDHGVTERRNMDNQLRNNKGDQRGNNRRYMDNQSRSDKEDCRGGVNNREDHDRNERRKMIKQLKSKEDNREIKNRFNLTLSPILGSQSQRLAVNDNPRHSSPKNPNHVPIRPNYKGLISGSQASGDSLLHPTYVSTRRPEIMMPAKEGDCRNYLERSDHHLGLHFQLLPRQFGQASESPKNPNFVPLVLSSQQGLSKFKLSESSESLLRPSYFSSASKEAVMRFPGCSNSSIIGRPDDRSVFRGPEMGPIDARELTKIEVDINRHIAIHQIAPPGIQVVSEVIDSNELVIPRRDGEGTKPLFDDQEEQPKKQKIIEQLISGTDKNLMKKVNFLNEKINNLNNNNEKNLDDHESNLSIYSLGPKNGNSSDVWNRLGEKRSSNSGRTDRLSTEDGKWDNRRKSRSNKGKIVGGDIQLATRRKSRSREETDVRNRKQLGTRRKSRSREENELRERMQLGKRRKSTGREKTDLKDSMLSRTRTKSRSREKKDLRDILQLGTRKKFEYGENKDVRDKKHWETRNKARNEFDRKECRRRSRSSERNNVTNRKKKIITFENKRRKEDKDMYH